MTGCHGCYVMQDKAARATSTAPAFFTSLYIGDVGLQEKFIDAGIEGNKPLRYLVEEVGKNFGPEGTVSRIGKPMVAGFKAAGLFQRLLPLDLINVLANMATDSETESSTVKARFRNCSGLYHRLTGLEEARLEEWEKPGEVKSHAISYLSDDTVSRVDALVGKSSQTFPLVGWECGQNISAWSIGNSANTADTSIQSSIQVDAGD
ncbi:hypothetical protein V491_02024 [Pseudogymnoascus sp. VKM F-3775]|nr:hypothetical protein V491_02024 [Pseudogymnoascus sp. VKM F-3775]